MNEQIEQKKLEEIWESDLLGRQAEADLLLGYIESISQRNPIREDARAFTIAIDAPYGEGKTFFLKRLSKHLAFNHPVAFVDAWADDLSDQPLTALAATLKSSLDTLIKKSVSTRKKWEGFLKAAGKVAKIAAKGAAVRSLGLVITTAAAKEASDLLTDVSEDVSDAVKDSLKDIGSDVVDGASKAFDSVVPNRLMNDRIATYEAGKVAIDEMKASLNALIATLDEGEKYAPIIIIIDELDRCRPTYAVKLLEEIKHLFDVPGLVFILGMNGEQLSHSLGAAYGAKFDGQSYLRRFISRKYRLRSPDLTPLVDYFLQNSSINKEKLEFPSVNINGGQRVNLKSGHAIALYMKAYGLHARDAHQIIDILETCCALTANIQLTMPYLMPLIIGKVLNAPSGQIIDVDRANFDWEYSFGGGMSSSQNTVDPLSLANEMSAFAKMSQRDLVNQYNSYAGSYAIEVFINATSNAGVRSYPLANPQKYPELLETVGLFTNPNSPV